MERILKIIPGKFRFESEHNKILDEINNMKETISRLNSEGEASKEKIKKLNKELKTIKTEFAKRISEGEEILKSFVKVY